MNNFGGAPMFGKPSFLAPPSQIYVPVKAQGLNVIDNGGDLIAQCFTPQMAEHVAALMNKDAGL